MAKDLTGIDQKSKGTWKKKIIMAVIAFLAVLVIGLAVFIALLKMDIASLGTKVIGPKLVGVPGASLILPEMPEPEAEAATDQYESLEQAVEILKVTENSLKEKEKEAETLLEQIEELKAENGRLKIFEERYLSFEKDKKAFDEAVVAGLSAEEYVKWFEQMDPDNQVEIYKGIMEEKGREQELQDLIKTYNQMKPTEAADILSEMAKTRLEMVATIIKHLEPKQSGKILGQMEPKLAARISAYLYPEQ